MLVVGSLIAGFADSAGVEIGGRALQGAAAALIAPAALTMVMVPFSHDPRELTKAMGLYGAAAPAGGTAGVFLGGVLTQGLDWRYTLLVDIPLALAVLVATPRLLPGVVRRGGRVDLAGAITIPSGLALLVFGIVRANIVGWGTRQTVLAVTGGVALIALFVVIQAVRGEPLMPLSIFRVKSGSGERRHRVARRGVDPDVVPGQPMAATSARLQPVCRRRGAAPNDRSDSGRTSRRDSTDRHASRVQGTDGRRADDPRRGYRPVRKAPIRRWRVPSSFLPASLVAALGLSLTFIPALMAAIGAAPPEQGGLASEMFNTTYQVGSALGLGALTALSISYGADHVGDARALTHGFHAAFLGGAGVAVIGSVTALTLIRTPKAATAAAATAESPPEEVKLAA